MKWFKEKKFVCKCCGELPPLAQANVRALVENVLEPAREKLGKPIRVNSGYRCLRHNVSVGGVKNSQHLRGEAADMQPVKKGTTDFTEYTDVTDRRDSVVVVERDTVREVTVVTFSE